ncbi:Asp23/Gls24 family envelope stress response protein [Micromonospora sp. WMMD812]|uniref:Asp23/Gls24 family envelope stress response protein n=1 Tax=Micromonospora sp. WMMD812 TaxID=3015152 RepID=UPI00248B8B5D|nr:Asp23/Gls24 family envelope stress response protein [Micromonospora sp. WMMD812]WBB66747.1 Asp23/Gls24 family envelope stress response protein [Micromonospora sp. WMMD812]
MAEDATQEQSVTPGPATGGTTSVDDDVLEKIAVAAARSVPGVTDLGGDAARMLNSVLDRVGLDKVGDATRGASAKVVNGGAVINLVIVIEAGRTVPEVTEAVRVKVTEAVEAYGLRVDQVNIRVDDVALGEPTAPTA